MFLVVVALTTMLSTSVFAAQDVDIKVTVNDTLVEFPDAKPFVDSNGRTLIPVRFVTEAMGADVSWDQANQTAIIEKDGTKVEITIGQKDIKVTKDGTTEIVTMDTVAVAKENRTFVPIRFVAEALGAYVDYSNLYTVAEIVMPEEVTAAEIKRLRSYDMIQYLDLSKYDKTKHGWWLDREEYKSFTGNFWFSNSHYFLVTLDQELGFDVKNLPGGTKAPKGTNALDYARFVVQYAEDELEIASFPSATGKFDLPGYWSNGDLDLEFRTDNSLVYQCVCQPQALLSVRGIIDVYAMTERGLKLLEKQFRIENPVLNEIYSIDAEMVVAANSRSFLNNMSLYRLDMSDGIPVKVDYRLGSSAS